MLSHKIKAELYFRGRYAESDVSILYADIVDEDGNDMGTLSTTAETWQDGRYTKWTGDIGVSFRASDSEEFDLIGVVHAGVSQSQKIQNADKAMIAIKQCLDTAMEIEAASRRDSL